VAGVAVTAVLALAASSAAQGGRAPSAPITRNRLAQAIDHVVAQPAFAASLWGIEVRSLRTGAVLYTRAAQKNLKPASTVKLVIAAAALDALGPEARFPTTVESAAALDAEGRLRGDLYLVGRGDPSLSARFGAARPTAALEELAGALRAAGLRRVEGRLVGHEGAFRGERRGSDWSWEDLVWCYGAEVAALSFNDNCADLTLVAGAKPGDPALVERRPVTGYYSVVSTATTAPRGTKSELTLARDLGSNLIRLSGVHAVGDPPWEGAVALEDPARYAATVFAEVLVASGIAVAGGVATTSDPLPADVRVLATHESPPLAEILKVLDKESQNLYAELLLRQLGLKAKGEGTAEAGEAAVREFLERIGVQAESWALQDGSGLSRSNLVDAHGLVGLLAAMARHPYAQAFRESLAVAGVDGTLKARFRGTRAEGRLLAKTGTLRYANGLAGYATSAEGEPLAFAVFLTHHTGPNREAVAAIDEIALALMSGDEKR
jgi:D-alanyl-D-alanine carboxypeptidase/D-alanyl-D-alanine-endopeptidase (penicillin-binding protein 4)